MSKQEKEPPYPMCPCCGSKWNEKFSVCIYCSYDLNEGMDHV